MPLLHLKCDTVVEATFHKPGVYWCPNCDKEISRDETYRVGKRFSASGIGAMMAMAAALNMAGHPTERITKTEATSTFIEAKRQKRKKLYGLKTKQRQHARQKRRC